MKKNFFYYIYNKYLFYLFQIYYKRVLNDNNIKEIPKEITNLSELQNMYVNKHFFFHIINFLFFQYN